jgi:hypothetical protein
VSAAIATLRRHGALAALLACAAPLILAFVRQPGLASVGDDSASYLVLAQHFAGLGTPAAAWAPHFGHFPPLLPLLLAASGAASDFARAHAVVGWCAVAALASLYAHAWSVHRRRDVAIALPLAFLLLPTAWIGAQGILSEPLFLALSVAALAWHQGRLAQPDARVRDALVLGVLLGAALLTRLAGVALAAGCIAAFVISAARARRFEWRLPLAALLPAAAALALWFALRPSLPSDPYQRATHAIVATWLANPLEVAGVSARQLFDGWVATFTADADVSLGVRLLLAALGGLGLAGAARAAWAARADGAYTLMATALALAWVFDSENMRRLLHPLVPLLLLHAGEALAAILARAGRTRYAGAALGIAGALVAIVALPALVLIASRADDTAPVNAGLAPSRAGMTAYYTVIDGGRAAALAERHASVLGGLEALAHATPPGARVFWMRPEYVALLGGRVGVPWFYDWDARRLGAEALAGNVEYLVVARLHKSDLAGASGIPAQVLRGVDEWTRPVLVLPREGPRAGDFVLLKVDRAALEAWLARAPVA